MVLNEHYTSKPWKASLYNTWHEMEQCTIDSPNCPFYQVFLFPTLSQSFITVICIAKGLALGLVIIFQNPTT